MTALLVLYDSSFSLFSLCYFSCIVTWTFHPDSEVPSVDKGGDGHSLNSKFPKWPHSPRQAVLPSRGEELQCLELYARGREWVRPQDWFWFHTLVPLLFSLKSPKMTSPSPRFVMPELCQAQTKQAPECMNFLPLNAK